MQDMPMMPHFGGGRRRERGREEGKPPRRERSLAEISVTVWLTPENASFQVKNGLLYMQLEGEEQRVTLCRQFPMDMLWEFISVMNEEEQELGIIRSLEVFGEDTRQLLTSELEKRYYVQRIKRILSVKEQFGFSYWRVQTEEGEIRFTLRDTFRSISSVNKSRVFFSDVQGNRFEVERIEDLDPKSRRKLELYL